nr:tombus P33-like protein [Tolivirales sp.]
MEIPVPAYLIGGLAGAIAVVIILVIARLFLYSRGNQTAARLHTWVQDAGLCDGYDHYIQDGKLVRPVGQARLTRYIVSQLREQVGYMDYTRANEMVVSDLTRKLLKSHGMRPTHIMDNYPFIVAAYFMPTEVEVEANHALHSMYARQQRRKIDQSPY